MVRNIEDTLIEKTSVKTKVKENIYV
jgi:hypothetical protein